MSAFGTKLSSQNVGNIGGRQLSTIKFCIGIGISGPIAADSYQVRDYLVEVSYPKVFNFGLGPEEMPRGRSTLFIVTWEDPENIDSGHLRSKTYHRNMVVHKALAAINEILLAFKMVSIGHLDSSGLRTIGIDDTLFYCHKIDSELAGGLNCKLRSVLIDRIPPREGDVGRNDPFNTTELAREHIASDSFPVVRRYTRCYELLEHGFYSEAFIIAFSIMDDLIQDMLHNLLIKKGTQSKTKREEIIRGIKGERLKTFLVPLLKEFCGRSITDLWSNAEDALSWLNTKRNKIAHAGHEADYHSASVGIYACIKILHELHQSELINSEFPVGFFRHAKTTASWTDNSPEWVPRGPVAESMDFAS